ASDVYGLGATLYCLLTGQAPVQGNDQGEVLRKASRGEWAPPRQVKGDVPAALDAGCCKALALRPQDRDATALALAVGVEQWRADEPVAAYREPLAQQLGRWRRRNPAKVAVAAALLLAGLGFGLWLKQDADARAAVVAQEEAQRERDGRAA